MKKYIRTIISVILVLVYSFYYSHQNDVELYRSFFLWLFFLIPFFFFTILMTYMIGGFYEKEYHLIFNNLCKPIYRKLDSILVFNKYPYSKEKNNFRICFEFILFPIIIIQILFSFNKWIDMKPSEHLEGLGIIFCIYIVYRFSLWFFFPKK